MDRSEYKLIKCLDPDKFILDRSYVWECTRCGERSVNTRRWLTMSASGCKCVSRKRTRTSRYSEYLLKSLDKDSFDSFKAEIDSRGNDMMSRVFTAVFENNRPVNPKEAKAILMSVSSMLSYRRSILKIFMNEWLSNPDDILLGTHLKLCPFCGRIPTKVFDESGIGKIQCKCGITTREFDVEDDAVDFWNSRRLEGSDAE